MTDDRPAMADEKETFQHSLDIGPLTAIGLGFAIVLAALLRLPEITTRPPGFAAAEAAQALLARQTQAFGLRLLLEGAGDRSPVLAGIITVFGNLIGFDVEAARLATALCGVLAVLFTGLWLRRLLSPVWGAAGALVLAGSFWHLLFSRLALSPAAGTMALAAALWCLAEARSRAGQAALAWYLGLGLALGVGFLADPVLRGLPLLLGAIFIASAWHRVRGYGGRALRGWTLAGSTTLLITGPFVRSHLDQPRLLTPWARTLGLPGEPIDGPTGAIPAIMSTLRALAFPWDGDPLLNLPGDAFFSLILLPWTALGLIALLAAADDAEHRPTVVAWALGLVTLLVSASAVDPGHPGRIVVAGPLLAALPVMGFRAVLGWARVRTVRLGLIALIVVGLAGEMAWSASRYFQEWSTAPETATAFNAGTVAALREIDRIALGEPAWISTRDAGEVLTYLATTERRHEFSGGQVLPITAVEDGYLAIPDEAPLAPLLLRYLTDGALAGVTVPATRDDYHIYRIDDRLRQSVPLSAPTIPFDDGSVFYGNEIEPSPDQAVAILLAWHSPANAPPRTIELRLAPANRTTGAVSTVAELPPNPMTRPLIQIRLVWLELPDTGPDLDLSVALRDADGGVIPAPGVDTDGFLFLNRYRLNVE
jgi:hypothetical protein